jgi:hypothetical protein
MSQFLVVYTIHNLSSFIRSTIGNGLEYFIREKIYDGDGSLFHLVFSLLLFADDVNFLAFSLKGLQR